MQNIFTKFLKTLRTSITNKKYITKRLTKIKFMSQFSGKLSALFWGFKIIFIGGESMGSFKCEVVAMLLAVLTYSANISAMNKLPTPMGCDNNFSVIQDKNGSPDKKAIDLLKKALAKIYGLKNNLAALEKYSSSKLHYCYDISEEKKLKFL